MCTFNAAENRDDIRPKVNQLLKLCRRAVNNNGTRRIEEHTYQLDDDAQRFQITAGCGSVDYFRDNLYKRLAEAFHNFQIHRSADHNLPVDLFPRRQPLIEVG